MIGGCPAHHPRCLAVALLAGFAVSCRLREQRRPRQQRFGLDSFRKRRFRAGLTVVRIGMERNLDDEGIGPWALLGAARRHGVRFHHVSTDEVFGDMPIGSVERFDEASPYRPSSPYSASKASSDHLAKSWFRTYGVPVTVSNCVNNYGPRQNPEKLIPRQIGLIGSGRRPQLYGGGENVRDWIHVDDRCSAIWAILNHGVIGESYVVGADCERSNLEIASALLRVMGCDDRGAEFIADSADYDRRCAVDVRKLKSELGWRSEHRGFERELAVLAGWYS